MKRPACYASQHLSPEEWGVLDVCMRLTHGGRRPLCLDGRTLASRFGRCNKNAIYRIVGRLDAQGWLVKTGGGERNTATGKYNSTTYKVLSHTQWSKLHPNACSPVPESGQVQSRFEQKPVPESGHSSVSTFVLEASVKENRASLDVRSAIENLPDEAKTDNYLQTAVRAPRSSGFCWSAAMMNQIRQDFESEPSFERIWRGPTSRQGSLEPGGRDWGVLRRLGGMLSGSQEERWSFIFERLQDAATQYEPGDAGKLFSIVSEQIRRELGVA
jgi:hypothetical protein